MELLYKENNVIIGKIVYSFFTDKIISIDSTFVDDNYRQQGIANKLMLELVKFASVNNYKCKPVCSYAVNWFNKNVEYHNILQ